MKNLFLKAKHWQLFIPMFGLPILFQIVNMIFMFSSVNENGSPESSIISLAFFPIMMFLYVGLMFGWFWSVATGLQEYIPIEHRPNLKKYKIFFFTPLFYISFLLIYIGTSLFVGLSNDSTIDGIIGILMFVIIPLHLFSMFCMFYQLYFISKTIKMVVLKRPVIFSDFLGEFFMVWFLPLGIWVLQPKINEIVNGAKLNEVA